MEYFLVYLFDPIRIIDQFFTSIGFTVKNILEYTLAHTVSTLLTTILPQQSHFKNF